MSPAAPRPASRQSAAVPADARCGPSTCTPPPTSRNPPYPPTNISFLSRRREERDGPQERRQRPALVDAPMNGSMRPQYSTPNHVISDTAPAILSDIGVSSLGSSRKALALKTV